MFTFQLRDTTHSRSLLLDYTELGGQRQGVPIIPEMAE